MKTRHAVVVLFGFLVLLGVAALACAQAGVTGAPYCGTQESETTQTLIDGTHITHKSKTHVCRDSQGRTRTEVFSVNGQGDVSQYPANINIFDPVDHVQYMLDVNRHSARRIVQSVLTPPVPQQFPVPPIFPTQPKPGPKMETATEHLDSQIIEGVLVEGTRTTTTLPVGIDGNDRPIVTVNEIWVSRELHTVVLTKRTDPRFGDTLERLSGIDRSEPDPAIFRVPADYSIEDVPSPFMRP
jgi:hypothetical protein